GTAALAVGAGGVGEERGPDRRMVRLPRDDRPAVVAAGHHLVDLLPGTKADVVDEEARARALEGEGERIAQPHREDAAREPAGLRVERIVGRRGAVLVEAQQLAERR